MPKGTNRKSRRPIPGMRPGKNPSLGKVDWDHAEYSDEIRRRNAARLAKYYEDGDGNP